MPPGNWDTNTIVVDLIACSDFEQYASISLHECMPQTQRAANSSSRPL